MQTSEVVANLIGSFLCFGGWIATDTALTVFGLAIITIFKK